MQELGGCQGRVEAAQSSSHSSSHSSSPLELRFLRLQGVPRHWRCSRGQDDLLAVTKNETRVGPDDSFFPRKPSPCSGQWIPDHKGQLSATERASYNSSSLCKGPEVREAQASLAVKQSYGAECQWSMGRLWSGQGLAALGGRWFCPESRGEPLGSF